MGYALTLSMTGINSSRLPATVFIIVVTQRFILFLEPKNAGGRRLPVRLVCVRGTSVTTALIDDELAPSDQIFLYFVVPSPDGKWMSIVLLDQSPLKHHNRQHKLSQPHDPEFTFNIDSGLLPSFQWVFAGYPHKTTMAITAGR